MGQNVFRTSVLIDRSCLRDIKEFHFLLFDILNIISLKK